MQPQCKVTNVPLPGAGLPDCTSTARCGAHPTSMATLALESWALTLSSPLFLLGLLPRSDTTQAQHVF